MAVFSPHQAYREQLRALERRAACAALATALAAQRSWPVAADGWRRLNHWFTPGAAHYAHIVMANHADPHSAYLLCASSSAGTGADGPTDWPAREAGRIGWLHLQRLEAVDLIPGGATHGSTADTGQTDPDDAAELALRHHSPGRLTVWRGPGCRREWRPTAAQARIVADHTELGLALPAGALALAALRHGDTGLLVYTWPQAPRPRLMLHREAPAILASALALQALWDSDARPIRRIDSDQLYWQCVQRAQTLGHQMPGLVDLCARFIDRLTGLHAAMAARACVPCLGGQPGRALHRLDDGRWLLGDAAGLRLGDPEADVLKLMDLSGLHTEDVQAVPGRLPDALGARLDPLRLRSHRLQRSLYHAIWMSRQVRSDADHAARELLHHAVQRG